jgi:hypothetical protein
LKVLVTVVLFALAITGYWYLHRPIDYPAGILVAAEPSQIPLPPNLSPIAYGTFQLKPLALFSVEARILHRRNYRYDAQAALVPTDLAVGWGPMTDQSVLDRLHITQSMRFYWFEYKLPPPIPIPEIVSHSSNIHIIPATPAIASLCKSLRVGSLVRLNGDLVEASGPGITSWRSSLNRTDSDNGACELLYLEEIEPITVSLSSTKGRTIAQH